VCRDDGFCSDTWYERCSFDANGNATWVTRNGDPCAITHVSANGAASGIGMSAAFCAALADATSYEAIHYGDVFTEGCRWTDGSAVVTPDDGDGCYGFPVSSSDAWPGVLWSFCGGPCGNVDCGETPDTNQLLGLLLGDLEPPCVGRSDDRAFGVCAATSTRCSAEYLQDLPRCTHWLTESFDGEQVCACMFTGDTDGSEPGAQGWVVPQTVCERYRDLHPGDVSCRDEDFALIP
jgi:hypothetical protein